MAVSETTTQLPFVNAPGARAFSCEQYDVVASVQVEPPKGLQSTDKEMCQTIAYGEQHHKNPDGIERPMHFTLENGAELTVVIPGASLDADGLETVMSVGNGGPTPLERTADQSQSLELGPIPIAVGILGVAALGAYIFAPTRKV